MKKDGCQVCKKKKVEYIFTIRVCASCCRKLEKKKKEGKFKGD